MRKLFINLACISSPFGIGLAAYWYYLAAQPDHSDSAPALIRLQGRGNCPDVVVDLFPARHRKAPVLALLVEDVGGHADAGADHHCFADRVAEGAPDVAEQPPFQIEATVLEQVRGGAGNIAQSKIRGLLDSGANVRVVAPQANGAVEKWASAGEIVWEARSFEAADLDGTVLVIAATSCSAVNGTIFREAQQRNILCNVVDDPEHCNFYYGAVVRRGQLQVAISTEGQSPALAQRIRRELEAQFGPEYAGWVEELGQIREKLFASGIDAESRRQLLHELASRDAFVERESLAREKSYGR